MKICKYNSEGYYDPTNYEAFMNIEREKKQAQMDRLASSIRGYKPLVYICSPYNALAQRYQKAADRHRVIKEECARRTSKRKSLNAFAAQLMGSEEKVTEFTPALWNAMVERVSVDAKGEMKFTFKNGTEISA